MTLYKIPGLGRRFVAARNQKQRRRGTREDGGGQVVPRYRECIIKKRVPDQRGCQRQGLLREGVLCGAK